MCWKNLASNRSNQMPPKMETEIIKMASKNQRTANHLAIRQTAK